MPLSLEQVIAQAGANDMTYVFDAPVHYVVFTKKDNVWNLENCQKYLAILDQIETTNGPGCMITIGTGKRHFSSGFDLTYWAESEKNIRDSIVAFNQIMARLLEFPMPTLCVFNGTAWAGGLIWGLCHDYRIMNENIGSLSLSELNVGLPMMHPFAKVTQAKISPSVLTRWTYATINSQKEGLKDGFIDDTYADASDLEEKLAVFVQRYAMMGNARSAIKTNKNFQFQNTIEYVRGWSFTPSAIAANEVNFEIVKKSVARLAKAAQAKKAAKKNTKEAAKPQPRL